MQNVKVLDKEFELYIPQERIAERVAELGAAITADLAGRGNLIFMGVLNGSFMFAGDLMKRVTLPAKISFVKLASYQGTASTGTVKQLIGLNEDLAGATVVVVEDIVDTGRTSDQVFRTLRELGAADIRYATLLYKPASYQGREPIQYVGFEIPNRFVLGYGLDYDGYGRNLPDLYAVAE